MKQAGTMLHSPVGPDVPKAGAVQKLQGPFAEDLHGESFLQIPT